MGCFAGPAYIGSPHGALASLLGCCMDAKGCEQLVADFMGSRLAVRNMDVGKLSAGRSPSCLRKYSAESKWLRLCMA